MFEDCRYLPNYYIKLLEDRYIANDKAGKGARKYLFEGPGNYQYNI